MPTIMEAPMLNLSILAATLTATAAITAVALVAFDGRNPSRRAVAVLLMRLALILAGALAGLLQAGTSGLGGS